MFTSRLLVWSIKRERKRVNCADCGLEIKGRKEVYQEIGRKETSDEREGVSIRDEYMKSRNTMNEIKER